MYCSHCGKKVGDTMLFCPFCGEPIVIPEQDDDVNAAKKETDVGMELPPEVPEKSEAAEIPEAEPAPVGESEAPREAGTPEGADDAAAELVEWNRERLSHVDEWARPEPLQEPFSPLELTQDPPPDTGELREEIERRKQSITLEKKPPETRRTEETPVRLDGSAPNLNLEVEGAKPAPGKQGARKHANTLVPPKTMDPNDIFMDSKAADYDAYDPYDDEPAGDYDEGFVYEDDEEASFFMRHLRGIVGLALFVILLLLFVIYAFSKAGQISLARINAAWSTEAYSTLGYQNYQDGQYAQAGLYYERALQRDAGNYSFASSAAMAYYEANDTEKSAAMLKKCVEIDPTKLEPYVYLLKLYPDAASRPWDITQLLQQGYRQTGDSRLNVTG